MHKNKKGFTLIELLVVMFIIAILATLVIVNVANARKSARDAKRVANLKSIQTALEMYAEKNAGYPMTVSSINTGAYSTWTTTGTPTGMSGTWYYRPGVANGWAGMCKAYNYASSNPWSPIFDDSGSNGWITDLAPGFIPVLPSDPKPKGDDGCYIYKSNGTDYMVLANNTMETCLTATGSAGCGYSESTSIKEIARPAFPDHASIAVYSSGASAW